MRRGGKPTANATKYWGPLQGCLAGAGWRPGQEKGVKLGTPAKGVVYGMGGS